MKGSLASAKVIGVEVESSVKLPLHNIYLKITRATVTFMSPDYLVEKM